MAPVPVTLRVWFAVVLIVAQLAPPLPDLFRLNAARTHPARLAGPDAIRVQAVRISQVFGGGGPSASYPCDFVELFNATPDPVSLAGWSIQYSAATSSSWWFTDLSSLTIEGYRYLQILFSCGSASPPPGYDLKTGTAMNPTDGKVALAIKGSKVTGITDPTVVDFVGYGIANEYEGSGAAPALSSTKAARRGEEGCIDTDDNRADFATGAVAPRNSQSPTHPCPETAPVVWGTSPKRGASNVARDTLLTVDFSERVNLDEDWFEIRCDLGGVRNAASSTVTGGPYKYTIDPVADLFADDECRMTVNAAAVHDADESDPPDTMSADYVVDFRTVPGQCGDPAYPIHVLQGAGADSAAAGQVRTIEGVVTGDFQDESELWGYFLQEDATDADADPHTSEGIFVDEHGGTLGDVSAGSRVRVTGTVNEVDGMTALTAATRMLSCPQQEPLAPVQLTLPLGSTGDWERYEGMLIQFADQLTVAGSAELGSDGRLTLVRGPVPLYYTQQNAPDVAGYAAWAADLALQTVILDDGSQVKYPDPIRYPSPELTAANTVRAGDAVETGLTGVVDGRSGTYAIQPAGEAVFLHANPRPAAPARTTGNVRVAFVSLGDYFDITIGAGGPRGASNPDEFVRQRDKLTRALLDLDADVIAVSKLENDGFTSGSALADLAEALNGVSAPGTYTFVDPALPSWGADVVTVGVLYRGAGVVPVGAPAILATGAFDQETAPPVHRAPMAQTFEERTWGERFTVVVNEWHDRTACPASGGDAEAGDGQGCWNAARTTAASDLLAWLATDPSGSRDPDYVVVGELNAFSREDPIRQLTGNGYIDLIDRDLGGDTITTLINARAGRTDHALASPGMEPQVVGTSVWAINAEEPPALDYQTENKSPAQQANLYAPDPYRSSDQNPVVVDVSLIADQSDLGANYGIAWHTGQGAWRLGAAWGGEDDGATRTGTAWNDGQGELEVTVNGPATEQYACLYGWLDFSDGVTEPGLADHPDGDWDANENVIMGHPLPPGDDQLVPFTLPAGTLGQEMLNMRLRLIPAPDPLVPDCTSALLAPSETVGPTGRADGGEVEDYAFEPVPLAVDLVSFASRVEEGTVVLRWETGSEQDLSGFDLHRGPSSDGPWEQVNLVRVPARRPGSSMGASYEYEDGVGRQATVWYRLTAVDLAGKPSGLALTQTALPGPNALHLAAFRANPVGPWPPLIAPLAVGVTALLLLAGRRRWKSR